jgi:hypothetical protein
LSCVTPLVGRVDARVIAAWDPEWQFERWMPDVGGLRSRRPLRRVVAVATACVALGVCILAYRAARLELAEPSTATTRESESPAAIEIAIRTVTDREAERRLQRVGDRGQAASAEDGIPSLPAAHGARPCRTSS